MGQRDTRVSTTIQPNTTRRAQQHKNQNANALAHTRLLFLQYATTAAPDNDDPHQYMRNAHMHMGQRDTRVSTTIQPNTTRRAQQHKTKMPTLAHTRLLPAAPDNDDPHQYMRN